jgi:uncharacterized protein (DUF486 family)
LKHSTIFIILGIICLSVAHYLLTIPGTELPHISWFDKFQADKLVHITMFFSLCFFFSYSVIKTKQRFKWIIIIAVTGLLYGVAMEFVQKYFVKFRSFDIDDMIADGIGCFICWYWFYRKFKREEVV